ncbi:MAG: AhpC/TSA family protein [Salinivirgaceae bacterium]|nr:AhpC/TSA family protein [Salinivirgaceae bacterium]
MKNRKILIGAITMAFACSACSDSVTVPDKISVSGTISGAQGKYLKVIDMTKMGFAPDSIQLDANGSFAFELQTSEPKDYVLYINTDNCLRIVPCANDTLKLTVQYPDLVQTYKVWGSAESERLSGLMKLHYAANYALDTLNAFYMAHQLDRKLPQIVSDITRKSDSILKADRAAHENFIKTRPGSLASYVALSSKLGVRTNLFNIQDDFELFEMVDTALFNRFDTTAITIMLRQYVQKARAAMRMQPKAKTAVAVGDTLPDIALSNPYGDTIRLSKFAGDVVLVHFWGSWCRPCRQENIELRRVFGRYRSRGFQIYSIALERSLDDWKNCIREDRMYWINHVSELNYMDSKVAKQLGITSIPANILIDGNRVVLATNLNPDQLRTKLDEVMRKR